jgi:hypothetical protein
MNNMSEGYIINPKYILNDQLTKRYQIVTCTTREVQC